MRRAELPSRNKFQHIPCLCSSRLRSHRLFVLQELFVIKFSSFIMLERRTREVKKLLNFLAKDVREVKEPQSQKIMKEKLKSGLSYKCGGGWRFVARKMMTLEDFRVLMKVKKDFFVMLKHVSLLLVSFSHIFNAPS